MIRGVIFDLDGTVYRGDAEVPGASGFVRWLHGLGIRTQFVTNRANRTPEEIAAQLRGYGIPCESRDVLTSSQAAVQYLRKGSAWFIGEDGLRQELVRAGIAITDQRPDYVIISFDRDPTPAKIAKAAELIKAGARFVATNPDRGLPTEDGFRPGTGVIVDAVSAAAGGAQPVMIGKPERLILDIALERLDVPREQVINVGDNLDTDIPAGVNAGLRSVFITTGVSKRSDLPRYPHAPTWIVDTYDELRAIVERETGSTR